MHEKTAKEEGMENQSYYINRAGGVEDIADMSLPLQVNCTGYVSLTRPFTTNGCRRDWYLQLMDEGRLKTEGGILTPGQFIVRSPEKPYRYSPENGAIGYYWIHFTGNCAADLLQSAGIRPDEVLTVGEDRMQPMRRDFGILFREFMLRRPGCREMSASMLAAILIRLGRGASSDSADGEKSGLKKRLEHSAAYIHNHYTENLSVTELAEMEHLSESRFRDIFREAFGAPPMEYIIGLRIAHACELLLTTDLNISETAAICGYTDMMYFCRLFRRKMGVSPAAYRKNAAEDRRMSP